MVISYFLFRPVIESLVRGRRLRGRIFLKQDGARCVLGRALACGMQSLQEGDESGGLRRTQVFAIGGHVAASLNDLANQLIVSEADGNGIKRRTAPATLIRERVTVVALLELKDGGALALEGGAIVEELGGDGEAAPCVHHRTPRSVLGEVGERGQRDGSQQDDENSEGAAAPAFFAFAGEEGQQEQSENCNHRSNQEGGCFHRRGQVGEHGIEPEEEEVGLRSGLNDGGIGRAGRAEWAEIESAKGDGKKDEGGKEHIFPNGAGDEGYAVFLGELVIFLDVGGLADDAAGHGPFVDSQFDDHQQVHGYESNEKAGDNEDVEREEARKSGTGNDRAAEH